MNRRWKSNYIRPEAASIGIDKTYRKWFHSVVASVEGDYEDISVTIRHDIPMLYCIDLVTGFTYSR